MKETFYEVSELEQRRARNDKRYLEFLRVPEMSAGIYVLPSGGTDTQSPHEEDELYYVIRGEARMKVGAEERGVAAGSVIFVPARMEHRFYDISAELMLLVFFAPAESS
jgi:mannose-6-phosphate isomerase-like protein (cupin superfamily)